MTFIAWHALVRSGEIKTELDAFIKSCIQVSRAPGVEGEEEGVNPTQPAAGAGS
jgi:hypothetical protein